MSLSKQERTRLAIQLADEFFSADWISIEQWGIDEIHNQAELLKDTADGKAKDAIEQVLFHIRCSKEEIERGNADCAAKSALHAGLRFMAILRRSGLQASSGRKEDPVWKYIRDVHKEGAFKSRKEIWIEAERRFKAATGRESSLTWDTFKSHFSNKVLKKRSP